MGANKADMEEGLAGVQAAPKTLRDYYSTDDKAHVAQEGAGASVIGLLEVVESDFSKAIAEMIATEKASQAAYDAETQENAVDKAAKEKDVEYKTKESATLDKEVADATNDRTQFQEELDAVQEYLKKLHDQCDETVEPYAIRAARRQAEIAGLKEALEVLESEGVDVGLI